MLEDSDPEEEWRRTVNSALMQSPFEGDTVIDALMQIPFDEQPIQRDQTRMQKIVNVCMNELADRTNNVCEIENMIHNFSTKQRVEHAAGRMVTGCLRKARDAQTTVTNWVSEMVSADEESLASRASFRWSWKVLQVLANNLDESRKACLALCASKMVLKYGTFLENVPAKYGDAEMVWETGFGTCHEYATLAVFLAGKFDLVSWVDMEAGGEGNRLGNDDRITDWELESCRKSFAPQRHETANVWDKCMVACSVMQFGTCSALWAFGGEYVAPAAACVSFLYYAAQHQYPVFAWGGYIYRAEVLTTFMKRDNKCKFFKSPI